MPASVSLKLLLIFLKPSVYSCQQDPYSALRGLSRELNHAFKQLSLCGNADNIIRQVCILGHIMKEFQCAVSAKTHRYKSFIINQAADFVNIKLVIHKYILHTTLRINSLYSLYSTSCGKACVKAEQTGRLGQTMKSGITAVLLDKLKKKIQLQIMAD